LVIARVYVRGSPSETVGLGHAVFTIATLALFALATTTVAVAVLLVKLGTMLLAEAVTVSAMVVPDAVPGFTCRMRLKLAAEFSASVVAVQVIVPVPPAATPLHVQPGGAVIDTSVVLGGVV
jgi:hypothetical protein